jgi:hypothetical protein
MSHRRFPPPCSIVENPESFVITDATAQALVYLTRGAQILPRIRR